MGTYFWCLLTAPDGSPQPGSDTVPRGSHGNYPASHLGMEDRAMGQTHGLEQQE